MAAATPGAAGATLNGRDFLFGGGVQAGLATVQEMTAQQISGGKAGTVAGRLPGPRSGLAAVTIGGTAYLLGGTPGPATRRTCWPLRTAASSAPWPGCRCRSGTRRWPPWATRSGCSAGRRPPVRPATSSASPCRAALARPGPPGPASHARRRPGISAAGTSVRTGAAAFALGGTLFIAGGQVSPGSTASAVQVLSYRPGRGGQRRGATAGAGGQRRGGGDRRHRVPGRRVRWHPPVPTVTRIQLAPDPPAYRRRRPAPWLGRPLSGSHLAPRLEPGRAAR